MVMKKKVNPEGYVVGPDATIEDIDLDKEVVHYQVSVLPRRAQRS
jgi:hypothetical protein